MKALPKEGSTTDWREKVTRRVFAVGGVDLPVPEVRVCASCRRPIDPIPGGVYKLSQSTVHCGDCLSHHFDMLW